MILFRCPSCGAAYRVDDTYAGGSADCQNCGHHISIPTSSDPEVVLVFHAGESEEGRPMTREEVARAFEKEELRATDLVLDDGIWRPLAVELRNMDNSAAIGDKSDLPFELEIESEEGRTVLHSLPLLPIQKLKRARTAGAGAAPAQPAEREKKIGFSVFAPPPDEGAEPEESAGAAGAAGARKIRIPRSVWIGAQVLLGLIALAAGYKFGFGPLISAMRGRPTVVFVAAPDSSPYDVTLGWRRLHAKIPRGGKACAFALYVCPAGEHQTLRLRRLGGRSLRLSLKLRPGAVLLINPEGRQKFAVFEPEKLAGKSLAEPRKHLVEQIAHNVPPLAAGEIANRLNQWTETLYQGTENAPILSGRKYRFDRTMVSAGSSVYQAISKLHVHPSKTLIPIGARYTLNFKEGTVETAIPPGPKKEAELRLPAKTVALPAKLRPKIPKDAALHIRFSTENAIGLSLDLENQNVRSRKGMLHGRWEYRATFTPEQLWHWSWTYHGSCKFKEKTKVKGHTRMVEKTLRVRLRTIDDRPTPLFELE